MKTQYLNLNENIVLQVKEDTQFVLNVDDFSREKKNKLELLFETPGVNAEVIFIYKLKKGQFLNLSTVSNHKVSNTSCDVKIKGVLEDNAVSNYVGKIFIKPKAQQTKSFLHDDVLVLGENTKNSSQPILEIEANDVSASHGATTGRVSEDQIYYLQSRGLSRQEALKVIMDGFFESLLVEIKDPKVREKVINTL